MRDPESEPMQASVELPELHRLCQRLCYIAGGSQPPQWPGTPGETLLLLESLVEMCGKKISRDRVRQPAQQQLKEERERLELMKSAFLKNVSHELRTPLASIEGFASALLGSLDPKSAESAGRIPVETQLRFLSIINQEARRLGELIEDVLDISGFEARPLTGRPTEFSAQEVFGEALATYRLQWGEQEAAPIKLDLTPLPSGPNIFAHREAVREILRHLLDNAHKFSGGKEIVLGAGPAVCSEREPAAPQTRLWVRDQGIGIPPSEQPHVFERFYRVETNSHTYPGAGLGLSIVQRLAQQSHGAVSVDSALGKGATFTILLPAQKSA